jgi:hypothetical protein
MRFKKTLILVFLCALTINLPLLAQAPEDLLAMMSEYSQGVVDHDLDKVMSYYADDVIVEMTIYPGMEITMGPWRGGWAGAFQAPGWHTDHGITLAVENMVVVDHNSVRPESPGVPEQIGPHFDVIDFVDGKIVHEYVYGGGFMPPELPPAVPAADVPAPAPTGLSPLEANAEFVARWNSHDAAAVASMQDTEAKIFVGCLNSYLSRGEIMAINQAFFDAIPDISLEVRRTVDMGDGWVLTELTWKGFQAQTFMGVESMGYPVELNGVQLIQYNADGLITKMRLYFNGNHLLDQMASAPWPLDGIWLTTYPMAAGNMISTTVYTAQDAAKTRYSGTLEFLNSFGPNGLFPDSDPSLTVYAGGEAVMVGRNKYDATYLGYYRKYDASTGVIEVLGINTVNARFELLSPDQLQGVHGFSSYYLAEQDADQDGFPDEGQEPIFCSQVRWTGKRLTPLPGCTPPPGE